MFFARRPSPETIDRFFRDSKDLPLSYSPAGIVSGETARPGLDELVTVIGCGRADFERARAALASWKHFDLGWVELFPSDAPVAVGTVVTVEPRRIGRRTLRGLHRSTDR